jgi:hypothetical protein
LWEYSFFLKRVARKDKKVIDRYFVRLYPKSIVDNIVYMNPQNVDWIESVVYPFARFYLVTIRFDIDSEPKDIMVLRSLTGGIHIAKTFLQKHIKD